MAVLDGLEQVDDIEDLAEVSARRDDTFAAPSDSYAETWLDPPRYTGFMPSAIMCIRAPGRFPA